MASGLGPHDGLALLEGLGTLVVAEGLELLDHHACPPRHPFLWAGPKWRPHLGLLLPHSALLPTLPELAAVALERDVAGSHPLSLFLLLWLFRFFSQLTMMTVAAEPGAHWEECKAAMWHRLQLEASSAKLLRSEEKKGLAWLSMP